jgi:hypothetical protein
MTIKIVIKEKPDDCRPGEYVTSKLVQTWPRMEDKACIAFRKFTGVGKDGYNLVRQGPRIFAVGLDVAKCVYNHSRQFT